MRKYVSIVWPIQLSLWAGFVHSDWRRRHCHCHRRCSCRCCCCVQILPGRRLYNLLLSICFYTRSSYATPNTIHFASPGKWCKRRKIQTRKFKRVLARARSHTEETSTKTTSPPTMSMTRKTESSTKKKKEEKRSDSEIAQRNSSLRTTKKKNSGRKKIFKLRQPEQR